MRGGRQISTQLQLCCKNTKPVKCFADIWYHWTQSCSLPCVQPLRTQLISNWERIWKAIETKRRYDLRTLMNWFWNTVQCAVVGFYLGRSVDGFHGMWQSRSSDLLRAVPELKSILESQPNFRSMHLLHPILRNRTREPFSAMAKCFNLELDYFFEQVRINLIARTDLL